VPGDVSLVSLAHEPFLDHLVPEVTGYRVDPEKVARLVVRRLERIVAGQTHPGGSPWITPDTVTGASVSRIG
jgi:DNA-binding LacI/PurR family transcriptional regulator